MASTATEAHPAADVADTQPARRGRRLVIVALLVALIAAAGAGAYFFYFAKHGAHGPAHEKAAPAPTPTFFALDPFTVNLLSDDGERYIHVGLTLALPDPKVGEDLTTHMPEVRSRILLLLSNKKPEDLATLDGKRKLASEIKAIVEKPYAPGAPPINISDVLFTDFVVQ